MASDLERALETQLRALGLPEPEREYRFGAIAAGGTGKGLRARLDQAGLKDWRFDFAWLNEFVAVEVNGGTWVRGRHNRGSSVGSDYEKLNAAQLLGWIVLQFTGDQIASGEAAATIERAVRRAQDGEI